MPQYFRMSRLFSPSMIGIQNFACTISHLSMIVEPENVMRFQLLDSRLSRPLLSCSRRRVNLPAYLPLEKKGIDHPIPGLKFRSCIGSDFSKTFQKVFWVYMRKMNELPGSVVLVRRCAIDIWNFTSELLRVGFAPQPCRQ